MYPRQTCHIKVGRGGLSNPLKIEIINVHDESVTICIDLCEARKIHKTLQCNKKDKYKENVMKINMVILTNQLKDMANKQTK